MAAVVLLLLLLGVAAWMALAPGPVALDPTTPAATDPDAARARPAERTRTRERSGTARPTGPAPTTEPARGATQPGERRAPLDSQSRDLTPAEATVHVLVRDDAGNRISAASVLAVSAFAHLTEGQGLHPLGSAKTGESGTVDLTVDVQHAATIVVVAAHEDSAAVSARIQVHPGAEVEATLELSLAVLLRGEVVDPDGLPVSGANVSARLSTVDAFGLGLVALSAEDGRFELPGVPATYLQGTQTVSASARGFASGHDALDPARESRELRIELVPGFTLRGRCVTAEGDPVHHALVSIRGGGTEQTAKSGHFQLAGVPLQGGPVVIVPLAHAPRLLDETSSTGADVDLGDVVLSPGEPVDGIVVDAEGKPLAGARIQLRSADLAVVVRSAVADAEGRFELIAVGSGNHRLIAQHARGDGTSPISATLDDVRAGARDVRVVMTGALYLTVRFLSAADRTPVEVREVTLTARPLDAGPDAQQLGWAWSGATMQSIRVGFEAGGSFDVTLAVPGFEDATLESVQIDPSREVIVEALFTKLPE